jgi:hypothetical protein
MDAVRQEPRGRSTVYRDEPREQPGILEAATRDHQCVAPRIVQQALDDGVVPRLSGSDLDGHLWRA